MGVNNNEDLQKSLTGKLQAVIDTELSKPFEETDSDVIDACVDCLKNLCGSDYELSEQEKDVQIKEILSKSGKDSGKGTDAKKRRISKKSILAAVIAALLMWALLIFTISGGSDFISYVFKDEMKEYFNSGEKEPVSYIAGNYELILDGGSVYYDTLEEFFEEENADVLYPGKTPDDIKIIGVLCSESGGRRSIQFVSNSVETTLRVDINGTVVPQMKEAAAQTREMYGVTVYFFDMENTGLFYCTFEYNGSCYTLQAENEQDFRLILENLKGW